MKEYIGVPASPGYGAGRAVVLKLADCEPAREPAQGIEEELAHLRSVRRGYLLELDELLLVAEAGPESRAILEAQREMAADNAFFDEVEATIRQEKSSAAWALDQCRGQALQAFSRLQDEYLRQRGEDVNQVCRDLLRLLGGKSHRAALPKLQEDYILLAGDVSPATAISLDKKHLRGLATERGGPTSHTAILAKELGIPAVVGIPGLAECAAEGEMALLDGETGRLTLSPNAQQMRSFSEKLLFYKERTAVYKEAEARPALSLDGRQIRVCVNLGQELALPSGSDGVGLLRTEFLFLHQQEEPGEEAQYAAYLAAVKAAAGKPVTIRTLDLGADKPAPFLSLPREENPALGCRGIRASLRREEMFLTQLRAILRASAAGPVRVMFPMIVTLEELLAAKALLETAKKQLHKQGQPFAGELPVGIMVETPAAVLLCDRLAPQVQFFSLGTNDLAQYITAADRDNEAMQALCSPFNISVLRAVHMVCEAAARFGAEVSICGEAASEPLLIPLWLGMGVQALSVPPGLVGRTKFILTRLDAQQMQKEAQHLLGSFGEMVPLRARLEQLAAQAGI